MKSTRCGSDAKAAEVSISKAANHDTRDDFMP
jgi:hypothetical protein